MLHTLVGLKVGQHPRQDPRPSPHTKKMLNTAAQCKPPGGGQSRKAGLSCRAALAMKDLNEYQLGHPCKGSTAGRVRQTPQPPCPGVALPGFESVLGSAQTLGVLRMFCMRTWRRPRPACVPLRPAGGSACQAGAQNPTPLFLGLLVVLARSLRRAIGSARAERRPWSADPSRRLPTRRGAALAATL